ncbi:15547_t:CDS:1, partial [Funneliformis geosporum]
MTKQALQKELLEKVKPGAKPSDIKRLKRSKSAGDIPTAPPLPESTLLTENKQLKAELA